MPACRYTCNEQSYGNVVVVGDLIIVNEDHKYHGPEIAVPESSFSALQAFLSSILYNPYLFLLM